MAGSAALRWLITVSSTFQDEDFDGSLLSVFSIITQVIIEIRALPLAENGVIFRYNHLRGGEYSGRLAFCGCA